MKYWVQRALVEAAEARVDVLDHGFTVGDGVFETLKPVVDADGRIRPFAAGRHCARLQASARGLGLAEPDPGEVLAAMQAVCDANPELAGGGRIRVTYTSGAGPLGSERVATPATLVVTAATASPWPPATTLALSPWPRNERSPLVGLKSTSYAENVLALSAAKAVGAGEALLANLAGDVCEGTGSNVFLVMAGRITTPPLSSGCLAGITRGLAIEWALGAGLEVDEVAVPIEAVVEAEELFVTSSTRDVHPVDRLLDAAGVAVWERGPGPRTAELAALFAARAAEDWNP